VAAAIGLVADGFAGVEERAARRRLEAQQHLGEHRLAAAGLPDHGHDLALLDAEAHLVDGDRATLAVPVDARQVLRLEFERVIRHIGT
jgi:hypothetical protein